VTGICDTDTQMLKDFCACPYWDRLWIAQEIVPAKKISLSCDSSICSWRLITAFCYHYFDGPLLTISGLRRRFSPRVCWFIEHKFQRGNTSCWKSYPSLDDLLAEFSKASVKTPMTQSTLYRACWTQIIRFSSITANRSKKHLWMQQKSLLKEEGTP
jgi:hypothetical protein